MANNILITPGSASIQFSGSAANTIRLQVEDSGSIAFYGNSGSLFGITDSLSGSLMSVNDISGLPILEVFSDDRIVAGTFNTNTLVVAGSRIGIGKSTPTTLLDISGSGVTLTGSMFVSGNIRFLNTYGITINDTAGTAESVLSLSTSNNVALTAPTLAGSIIYTTRNTSAAHQFLIGTSGTAEKMRINSTGMGIGKTTPSTILDVSGSMLLTGSLNVQGSITASVFGTSSVATTASYVLPAGLPTGTVSSSAQINTGSFTGSFIGALTGTGSWAQSASVAISASYAPGSSATFPYVGTAVITGSLFISGAGVQVSGTLAATTASIGGTLTARSGSIADLLLGDASNLGKVKFFDNTVYIERAFASGIGLLNLRSTIVDIGPTANGGIVVDNDSTVIQFYMPASANNGLTVTGTTGLQATTATTINATSITASNLQLVGLTPTTNANSVLVLENATGKIFTTSSVGGSSGAAFPYTGTAVITGSLIVSSSGVNVIGGGITGSFKGDGTGITGITANDPSIIAKVLTANQFFL